MSTHVMCVHLHGNLKVSLHEETVEDRMFGGYITTAGGFV